MDVKNIIGYLKTKSSGATAQEIASKFSQNEQEIFEILNSEKEIFFSYDAGLWKLTPLYCKDYRLESSYIGMEVIHKSLIPALSMGQGVITNASCGTITVKFSNKTATLPFPSSFKNVLTPKNDKIKEILIDLDIFPSSDYSYLEFELNSDNSYSVVGCNKDVETVTIPSKYRNRPVTTIGCTFDQNYCSKTKIINIPDSIVEILSDFDHCLSLESIFVDINNKKYKAVGGVLYSKDGKKLIRYPFSKKDTIFTVKDVTEICNFAFSVNSFEVGKLKHLFITDSVKKIGFGALDFQGLERVYIPETISFFNEEIFSSWCDDGGMYYTDAIVGGKAGSAIESYCYQRNIKFVPLKDDEIKTFFSMSSQQLKETIESIEENTTQFVATDKSAGYIANFENGILKISAFGNNSNICKTSKILPDYIRKKVNQVIIGDNIKSISAYAFDASYCNLEKVHIGKDVNEIDALSFNDFSSRISFLEKFTYITVDENNQHFKSVDGILYTYDMQTLVKYPQAKPDRYFEINCDIGPYAFEYANNLKCINVGKGCKTVGEYAFYEVWSYLHAWFDKSVECFEGDTPFIVCGKRSDCRRWNDLVVGGYKDSYVHKQCEKMGTYFLPIEEESEIKKFMTYPFAEGDFDDVAYSSKTWLKDPYYRECQKLTIMDKNGRIFQLGEHGEEVILPEGAVSIGLFDLEGVSKIVIPSTMNHIATCFHKPAPDLKEIVVKEGNKHLKIVEGHLYSTHGELLCYLPSAEKNPGVLPEGTISISPYAFNLLEKPFETLYIPSSVKKMEFFGCFYSNVKWFYNVEVSDDNITYKSIDGNLFSRDGKKLIYTKVSSGDFTIPNGTEIIEDLSLFGALSTKENVITIPESVKKINHDFWGHTIRTTSGSYAEEYAKKHNLKVELV